MKLLEDEHSDLISLKLPVNFIDDFIEYWENIKRIVKPEGKPPISWKKWNLISKKYLEILTIPFYNKWEHLRIMSQIKAYIKAFASITLHFKGGAILLPKQIILYEIMRPDNTLISSLKVNPSKKSFERILDSLCVDLNIRLIKSDVQIIQKLTQPGFSKSLDRFPKLKELAYGIRRDVRTVSSRLDYLIQLRVLSLIYLVDMARIGYQTVLLFHNIGRSQIPKEFHPYIVMLFPLPDGSFPTIMQYPFKDIRIYKKLLDFFNPEDKLVLKNQYRGWNFAGLKQNQDERWKLLPPILQDGGGWNMRLIIGETGIEFNLDPHYDPFLLSPRQGQLLGLIHKLSTMEEEFLSKQLGVGRAYITQDAKELLRNQVIFRFPIFSNLGLGAWIYFYIQGITSRGLMNVLEHLKFFPYVNIFYNRNSGSLVGRVNVPPAWTNVFIYRLTSLPESYPGCSFSYYIGPDAYAPWAFDILGTFNWTNLPQ
ncbi:MAG: hypothetical protein ACFFB2_03840 [Promethearchaeota archaeon]